MTNTPTNQKTGMRVYRKSYASNNFYIATKPTSHLSVQPEAVPARVTLGVTSLLTLSTQHANSQKSLPPVSYIKVFLCRGR